MARLVRKGMLTATAMLATGLLFLAAMPNITSQLAEAQQLRPAQRATHSDTPALGHSRAPAEVTTETALDRLEVRDGFRRQLVQAAIAAQRNGAIERQDLRRIRVASFSPAFLEQAEDLCVVQMAFSEDAELLPRTETGDIDRTAIDWEGFAAFLEKIIPLILMLLKAFGAVASLIIKSLLFAMW